MTNIEKQLSGKYDENVNRREHIQKGVYVESLKRVRGVLVSLGYHNKIPEMDNFNSTHSFSHSLEAGIQGPAWSSSDEVYEVCPPDVQMATSLL